mgnify:CR=1 FL=1
MIQNYMEELYWGTSLFFLICMYVFNFYISED